MTPGPAVDFCMIGAIEQRPPGGVPKSNFSGNVASVAKRNAVFGISTCAATRSWHAPAVEVLAVLSRDPAPVGDHLRQARG